MKIAVIGAGIIGITTAYELAKDGHEVTVFERRSAAAEETSFANAGLIAPGYVTPWAAPGMPLKVIKHLFSRHAPVKLTMPLSNDELRWMWRWFKACKIETYLANRAHLQRLAFYSRERLHAITAELRLEYDRSDGYLVLLRSQSDRQMVENSLQVLRDAGVPFNELGMPGARQIEPALNLDTTFFGAIHLPGDEVGNCRQFALQLMAEARRLGAQFAFNTTVVQINHSRGPALLTAGAKAPRRFDATVMCAGMMSAQLLKPVGLQVPLAAVYGYSISAPLREPMDAPRSAIMDERYKVAISRLGNRVRVAGSAEMGGTLAQHHQASIQTLYKVLHDWFPGAALRSGSVQVWKGARPMLPDGPPLIGVSGVPGLWLNLGHGSSGWALSCGSARALADQMAGRKAELEMSGFDVSRLNT
jgi:D-amino-acid dehydrogenase